MQISGLWISGLGFEVLGLLSRGSLDFGLLAVREL